LVWIQSQIFALAFLSLLVLLPEANVIHLLIFSESVMCWMHWPVKGCWKWFCQELFHYCNPNALELNLWN
jgi:hypothetical protein